MEEKTVGILSGLVSYLFWGVLGLFWALLSFVPALDILAYRFVFSLVFMAIILTIQKNWRAFFKSVASLWKSKKIIWVILASFLIAVNWGTYIYMVGHGQATEASLGYYIMPLFNVVIAPVFFKEPLTKTSFLAILLAAIGVVWFTIQTGSLPLNTLILATAFCLYGVIKKKIELPASFSLMLETIVCVPFGIVYLLFFTQVSFFSYSPLTIGLLVLSGVVTAVPLLLFTVAAKTVDFVTLSFIQYVNPTMQLLVAVFFLHEAFDPHKWIVFAFIWLGIAIFTVGTIHEYRQVMFQKVK
ncbi:protein RarD [Enterococcus sp. AZ150]|uniref:EamA family transporter RarD n=1 Tax=Enterococcus sp. AZ150 TaxID=2774866 RepID=UPI003F246A57